MIGFQTHHGFQGCQAKKNCDVISGFSGKEFGDWLQMCALGSGGDSSISHIVSIIQVTVSWKATRTLSDFINCISVFLGQSPKGIKIKTKINKWTNLQVLHSKRDHEQNEETIYVLGENICKLCDWQGLSFQNIQTPHIMHNPTTKHNPIEKWAEDLNRYFSKEDIHMANRQMKRWKMKR